MGRQPRVENWEAPTDTGHSTGGACSILNHIADVTNADTNAAPFEGPDLDHDPGLCRRP